MGFSVNTIKAFCKACGVKSILETTAPIAPINKFGLKLAPQLEKDTFQLSKPMLKETATVAAKPLAIDDITGQLEISNKAKKQLNFFFKKADVGTTRTEGNHVITKIGENEYSIKNLGKEITEELNPTDMLKEIKVKDEDLATKLELLHSKGEIDTNHLKVICDAVKRSSELEDGKITKSLLDYKRRDYKAFNRLIRGQSIDDLLMNGITKEEYAGKIKSETKALDNFISTFESKDGLKLFRTDNFDALQETIISTGKYKGKTLSSILEKYSQNPKEIDVQDLLSSLKGSDITQKSFLSTSIAKEGAEACGRETRPIMWKFTTKGKSNGLFIDSYSKGFNTELEYLMQRNSKININNLENKNGKILITADIHQ